jgi:hypothetical protein
MHERTEERVRLEGSKARPGREHPKGLGESIFQRMNVVENEIAGDHVELTILERQVASIRD